MLKVRQLVNRAVRMIFICVEHHTWLESSLKQPTTTNGVQSRFFWLPRDNCNFREFCQLVVEQVGSLKSTTDRSIYTMEIIKCYKSGLLIFLGNIYQHSPSYTFLCGPMWPCRLCFVKISGKRSRRKEGRHADFKQKLTKVNANVTKPQRDEELSGLLQASHFHRVLLTSW